MQHVYHTVYAYSIAKVAADVDTSQRTAARIVVAGWPWVFNLASVEKVHTSATAAPIIMVPNRTYMDTSMCSVCIKYLLLGIIGTRLPVVIIARKRNLFCLFWGFSKRMPHATAGHVSVYVL